jgi:LuxR family maltose regulon positive regulatory protein
MEVKLNLVKGDVRTAARILDEIEPYVEAREQGGSFLIVKTAVLLAQERFADVILTVESPVREMEREGRRWPLMELLPCLALALQAMSREEEAQNVLGRCLSLAAPEGYVYTFVKQGEPMRRLLLKALERGVETGYIQRLLTAIHIHEAAEMPATGPVPPTASRLPASILVEPLSSREMEVLRFLAQNYPDKRIAEALFIARETVHKHLKNIYEKLGVHRRTDAVTRARELGLL